MSDSEDFGLNDPGLRVHEADVPRPRPVGAPLPVGTGPQSALPGDAHRLSAAPPPGRALANPSPSDTPIDLASSLQRALSGLRSALPFVHRLLPLLDGNIGTAVSNLLTPHPPAPPPAPPVDLEPLENGIAELHAQHRDLRNQIVDQNSSLKRVEDQLEMVREATDRNTLEQQELLEDLKTVGNKVNMFALFALALLALSVLLNVILYLHIKRVLP
ncbi:MAG: hypothetical protein P4K86_09075 [Terracidiphilus sp.]|nr:hypothetical protein [Terracidiphilus sp.]